MLIGGPFQSFFLIENTANALQPEIELYINTVCTTLGQLSVSG